MADTFSYTTNTQKPPSKPTQNPTKFSTHSLYKPLIITLFLLLLPFFPQQAPEFIHQTFHAGSWELLQLVFVGIAVSYGLFSKRNDESDKEHGSKFDNLQSYVAGLLQVSSVFDDEVENSSGSDESKVQAWSSQYSRGEPVVMVAKETPVLKEKPLLLPVRSLKSPISESDDSESINSSRGFSSKLRKDEEIEENIVLRSPIPWRSRSGRMEMKEDGDGPPLFAAPSLMEDSELNSRLLRSQSSRSSRPNSVSPSPSISSPRKKLSPPPESQAKNVEDHTRKKIHNKGYSPLAPPPPPPPPPPPFLNKSPLAKPNYAVTDTHLFPEKELKRSDVSSAGKSLRSNRSFETEKKEANFIEAKRRTDSLRRETFHSPTHKILSDLPRHKKQEIPYETSIETDDDSELEDEIVDGNSGNEDASPEGVSDGGPDVDKKADEFIAKFREQIRLQRIASIRRSTEQISRKPSSVGK